MSGRIHQTEKEDNSHQQVAPCSLRSAEVTEVGFWCDHSQWEGRGSAEWLGELRGVGGVGGGGIRGVLEGRMSLFRTMGAADHQFFRISTRLT
ncbi:hypothetical protein BaRGS_00001744 [Batillaria attramentaria]|uniref:Uncharacterized protein n=1 Tax=Batillaria attramentaria TaxID=370345 RepID=A0ABD0M5Y8_9CAEN